MNRYQLATKIMEPAWLAMYSENELSKLRKECLEIADMLILEGKTRIV